MSSPSPWLGILDMAMSQFSCGALDLHALRNPQLSVPGGQYENGIPVIQKVWDELVAL